MGEFGSWVKDKLFQSKDISSRSSAEPLVPSESEVEGMTFASTIRTSAIGPLSPSTTGCHTAKSLEDRSS